MHARESGSRAGRRSAPRISHQHEGLPKRGDMLASLRFGQTMYRGGKSYDEARCLRLRALGTDRECRDISEGALDRRQLCADARFEGGVR